MLCLGDGNRTGIRRKTVGRLRYRLDVRQTQTSQVHQPDRGEGRVQADQRPVAETHPRQQ